jgi:hypothetical protein
MNTTAIKFSPSINIIRDSNYFFDYIQTPNSVKLFDQLLNDVYAGNKCHLIIGAYGTGKSSFLLAYQQTLSGFTTHFTGKEKMIKSLPNYEFIQIIGDNKSLFEHFAFLFSIGSKDYSSSDVIKQIEIKYKKLQKIGKGLAIIIDEFGKFLEYASKNNPGVELYFIQQLCEWINDTNTEAVLIGTLHQDFNTYSYNLNNSQQQEWSKVKGRFKEIVFNEPVEQLLLLASTRIEDKFRNIQVEKHFEKLFNVIKDSKTFPLRDYFNKEIARKLFPFDILSAAVMALSLQRYGQNERSLFSFIESNDHLSLNDFDFSKRNYYSIDKVYDYLISNYYSVINHKVAKSDYSLWNSIRKALEKSEGNLPDYIQTESQKIIKAIGVLNIFSPASATLDKTFYQSYGSLAMGIKDPSVVIEELEKFKIIKFARHSNRYIILQGTDLDIDLAIDEAGGIVERTNNLVETLKQYFDISPIAAKAVFYKKGTPRFFQFTLSYDPLINRPEGEIDGYINLVFNEEEKTLKSLKTISSNCNQPILFGYYKNTLEIRNTLFEIQKAKEVKSANINDRVAVNELDEIINHYTRILNHHVLDSLYSDNDKIEWFYNGAKLRIKDRRSFNQQLSIICEDNYPFTPIFKSELLNKTRTSGQISTARKELIKRLLNNLSEENLGFQAGKFPPEKSIYLSLIKDKGLHNIVNGRWSWQKPSDTSFEKLWEAGDKFLENSKGHERNLREFIDLLLSKPFKLKQGFIDFWVPIYLLAKADEYALFDNNGYIPSLNEDILELINKKPEMFALKAFDVVGIKLELLNRYRIFLSQPENSKPNNKVFIQTIKPFLNFYRELNEYSKKTNNLSKRSIAVREVIANAKDPEKTFFEDFPTALGYSVQELQSNNDLAEIFIKKLQEAIREIRSSYERLIGRFESLIMKEILGTSEGFPKYKEQLINRYRGLKLHMLTTSHKTFYSRIVSPLDDKTAWLNSISQASIGKPLSALSDEDEKVLFEKFADLIYTLDNLSELSKANIVEDEEDILKFEVTSFVEGLNKNTLRIPKTKSKEIQQKQKEIKDILGTDKKTSITVLAYLIKEYLNNE